jgi:hypothetical protein
VGGACGTHGRREESVQGFGGKARREETTWKTMALMGGWYQNGWGSVQGIQVAHNRGQQQALVNMVMNLYVLVPWG